MRQTSRASETKEEEKEEEEEEEGATFAMAGFFFLGVQRK